MQDRKKNPFDPLANPVFFFTKDAGHEKGVSLEGFAKKIVKSLWIYLGVGSEARGKASVIEGARGQIYGEQLDEQC